MKIKRKMSNTKVEGSGEMKCERNEKCWRKCKKKKKRVQF